MTSGVHQRAKIQSTSPIAPLGIEAAVEAKANPSIQPRPKIFDEFALTDRVALVSGGNRGIGLETAITLCEAGARVVYCFDLPEEPSEVFLASQDFVRKLGNNSRLEYFRADVRDQQLLWKKAEEIGDKEQRLDICVAAAGIVRPGTGCLESPEEAFKEVIDVNTNGVFFTAQAAGRQMACFGRGGSIIMIASAAGSVAVKGPEVTSYTSAKSAVLQMARSMACELGCKKIRVNTLSPGYIHTQMTGAFLDMHPELLDEWSRLNPLGRIGRPDELRGVVTWLASDASTFCTGSDIIMDGGHHAW
ncbi:hypothetical protein BKA82DRAFT_1001039 [Pisolithus tinctorius]|uniref:Sorbose reductase sou1 n=1 Tax=Pisolithus tinctorius Marx 270 TaxID=870435 RepID=A0A0C3P880_PISTI|nr:hypothetical protein BKA82DRAFT_1001039 [Pisolithus tinctorius]KIO03876.1 hypothetical protein M404DRAFT_1001039 [Pisolithus tinctorius Marx 270]